MNAQRTIHYAAVVTGAIVGTFFAYQVIVDLRSAVDDGGTGTPGIGHIVLCWPVLLTIVLPARMPQPVFFGILALLNALSFAFIFFLICRIVLAFFSRLVAIEVNNER